MYEGKKIVVVMPAYNAGKTLEKTVKEIPANLVDEIVLVDDASTDNTVEVGKQLGIRHIISHEHNKGYGGNQKSCYNKALELADDTKQIQEHLKLFKAGKPYTENIDQ